MTGSDLRNGWGALRGEEAKQASQLTALQRQKAQLVQEAETNAQALAAAQAELRQQANDMAEQLTAVRAPHFRECCCLFSIMRLAGLAHAGHRGWGGVLRQGGGCCWLRGVLLWEAGSCLA